MSNDELQLVNYFLHNRLCLVRRTLRIFFSFNFYSINNVLNFTTTELCIILHTFHR